MARVDKGESRKKKRERREKAGIQKKKKGEIRPSNSEKE